MKAHWDTKNREISVVTSAEKMKVIMFWDIECVILRNCIPNATTVTAASYESILMKFSPVLNELLGQKRLHICCSTRTMHLVIQHTKCKCSRQLWNNSPCSLLIHLIPSNFFFWWMTLSTVKHFPVIPLLYWDSSSK